MSGKRSDRMLWPDDPALRRQLKDAVARSLAGWEFGPELRARVLARVRAQELLPPPSRLAPGNRWISWAGAVAAAAVVAGLAILTHGGNLRGVLDHARQSPALDAREGATGAAAREAAPGAADSEAAPGAATQEGAPGLAAQATAPRAAAPPEAAESAPAGRTGTAPGAGTETMRPPGLAAPDGIPPQPEVAATLKAATPATPEGSGEASSASAAGAPAPNSGGVPGEEALGPQQVTTLMVPDAGPAPPADGKKPGAADGKKPGTADGTTPGTADGTRPGPGDEKPGDEAGILATQPGPSPQSQGGGGRPAGAGNQENGASVAVTPPSDRPGQSPGGKKPGSVSGVAGDLTKQDGVPATAGLALEYVQGSGAGLEPIRVRATVTPEVDLPGGLEVRAAVVTGEGPVPLRPPRAVRSRSLSRGEAWVVEFAWDQRLGDGSLAPTGVYTVRVEVWAEGLPEPLATRELQVRIVR
ncbi:MAG: hypothetical protein DIU70_004650 [Bacillota bacterium]